ncbi:MAG: hypothetical protein IH609_19525, partial [Dehalococcoidia bacterium]|nr:hypothetical protein [Dehalococcoidia bacterium]
MRLSPTAERAIEAYGGAEHWLRAGRVAGTISTGGLAFRSRGWPPLQGIAVEVDTEKPRVVFRKEPAAGAFAEYLDGQLFAVAPAPY